MRGPLESSQALEPEQRIALIAAGLGSRLVIESFLDGGPSDYIIRPTREYREAMGYTGSEDVSLVFGERDGGPYLISLRNYSDVSGWGTLLMQALGSGYPGRLTWASTEIKESGVLFFEKFRVRHGIALEKLARAEVRGERIERARASNQQFGTNALSRGMSLVELDVLVTERRLTMGDRVALILDEPHGRFEVLELRPGWRIQPSPDYAAALRLDPNERIHLDFVDLGDRPEVTEIRNSSNVSGWGVAMGRALERAYPEARAWRVVRVSQNGKVFWHKFSQRTGIDIGHDLAEDAAKIQTEIARIESAGDHVDGYRTPNRVRIVEDIDMVVALARRERTLPTWRRKWEAVRDRLSR